MSHNLTHYLDVWQLADPHLLARTGTSDVYTVTHQGETAILKLLTPVGIEDEHCGATALRHFDGRGSVRLLQCSPDAHLLEYADQSDLVPLVQRGDDDQATTIIAQVLEQLHSSPAPASCEGLIPLRDRFRFLFRQAETDRQQGNDSIFVRAARLADSLLGDQRELRVLHGDLHHENIRYSTRRGWLAFDPKGIYGERTYDTANTLLNPWSMPPLVENEIRLLRQVDILAEHLHLERARILAYVFVHACLSASWSLDDGQDASHALQVAVLAEPHARLT